VKTVMTLTWYRHFERNGGHQVLLVAQLYMHYIYPQYSQTYDVIDYVPNS